MWEPNQSGGLLCIKGHFQRFGPHAHTPSASSRTVWMFMNESCSRVCTGFAKMAMWCTFVSFGVRRCLHRHKQRQPAGSAQHRCAWPLSPANCATIRHVLATSAILVPVCVVLMLRRWWEVQKNVQCLCHSQLSDTYQHRQHQEDHIHSVHQINRKCLSKLDTLHLFLTNNIHKFLSTIWERYANKNWRHSTIIILWKAFFDAEGQECDVGFWIVDRFSKHFIVP